MTIKDIAEIAGVSISTVSKILNNKDENISPETRRKVLQVAKEYQYTPYLKIKENTQGPTYLIGLVVPAKALEPQLVATVEAVVRTNGYHLLLMLAKDREDEIRCIHVLRSKMVDGILYQPAEVGCSPDNFGSVPVVHLTKAAGADSVARVCIDYEALGYGAANHLFSLGHMRIGFLGEGQGYEQELLGGYSKCLFENNVLNEAKRVYVGADGSEAGTYGIRQLISANVSAVLCANEGIACGVYQTLASMGLSIPGDLSVMAVNTTQGSRHLLPALTSLNADSALVGEQAVAALLSLIESKAAPDSIDVRVEATLHSGDSVAAPASRKGGQEKLVVVGSMNIDVNVVVPRMPTSGETMIADNVILLPGGKGANQAVGVGKMGGLVYAIGRIGNDNDGKSLYKSLLGSGVKMDGIEFDTVAATGKAYINIAADGESSIVVYQGANKNLSSYQIRKYKHLLADARFCLLSLEIEQRTALYTMSLCKKMGVGLIVKPSGHGQLDKDALRDIDYLVPNEKELSMLVRDGDTVEEKASRLLALGVRNVIVTLGPKGCYLKNRETARRFAAAPFEAVDTTGAADAFISTLAVYLSEGYDLASAIHFATYAAGISITRMGVQPSMADRMNLEIYKEEINKAIQQDADSGESRRK